LFSCGLLVCLIGTQDNMVKLKMNIISAFMA
jgi:hypothetical protein